MADKTSTPDLWTPRSVNDTKQIYADWADTYDTDLAALAYATPNRIAQALLICDEDLARPVLDFGCGTGLSGKALKENGFKVIDGTDISPEMLAHAGAKTHQGAPLYRKLWLGAPGKIAAKPGAYATIIATGVISLGAAPPEMLANVLDALASGDLLAFSFNDPTLADPTYTAALDAVLSDGLATQVFREHGPHLNARVTGADVIVLRRT